MIRPAAPALGAALAQRFAIIALDNVVREFPHKLDHTMGGAEDVLRPRALHPAFHGSFDWHSCVHMHWLLARVLRRHPQLACAGDIGRVFDRHLSRDAIASEVAYLHRPGTASFERTYGWAWLLKLAQEVGAGAGDAFRRWQGDLAPLADAFVARYLDYLPKANHPLRTGMHPNSAFGLAFALDYGRSRGEQALVALCEAKAREWFGADRDYPAAWEPSGSDFLSPALMEADTMRRVLGRDEFASWLTSFLPGLADGDPATLFTPAVPSDRADPQIVHLDGLNLSRAMCFAGMAGALPKGDARASLLGGAAATHLAAGMQGLDSGDYMGGHWLATFAVLALDGP
ncbi:MAG: DUF2891 domain-containing protein [Betaproteobacteria bacterium]|jgi:hypothetical protein|nr:DUF2891 domain-containing protein [Betaproteobacteria bacterium]